jgi:hypothetical protein
MDSTSRCPLCGGPNDCGIALGKSVCWCFSAVIPAEVLAQVPEAERDRGCICRACAESATARTERASPVS